MLKRVISKQEFVIKNLIISICCLLIIISSRVLSQQETNKTRIGIFDSRCIAVTYGKSDEFMKELDALKNEVAKAKESGKEELAKELEKQGPTQQVLMHQQVFSNASINNILEKLKDKLPTLAKDNNIQIIISKWEIPFADETFEYVDITDQLVKLFSPDEQTKKIIDNIKVMDPIPIEKFSVNPTG